MAGAKRKPKGPDWDAIRSEYLAGAKPRELAAKHGVTPKRVSDEASRHKWREQREEVAQIVRENRPAVVAAVVLDEAAEWTRESLRMAREARAELWAARDGIQEKIAGSPDGPVIRELAFRNSPADWRAFVAALDALDAIGRRALKLDEPAPPVSQDGPGAGVVIVPADSDDWRSIDGGSSDG